MKTITFKAGSIRCFSFKLSLVIFLLFSSEFVCSQTNVSTDNLWFFGGGGLSNRINGAGRNTITWFGDNPAFQLAVQINQNLPDPDWVFRYSALNGPVFPVLYSPANISRIVGEGNLQFAGGGQGMSTFANGHMTITFEGNVGVGIMGPSQRFQVNNGNFLLTNGRFHYTLRGSTTTDEALFNIREGINNDRFWLGTQTPHILTIGTNGQGTANFYPGRYAVFYKDGDVEGVTISQANIDRYTLFVTGGILSEDYALGPRASWADFVLKPDYRLPPLQEVENHITEHHCLPDMPSETDVQNDGYSLHDMNVKLLQKIEELTLYVIRQNKKIEDMENRINIK